MRLCPINYPEVLLRRQPMAVTAVTASLVMSLVVKIHY
jgi:hypothetical protein